MLITISCSVNHISLISSTLVLQLGLCCQMYNVAIRKAQAASAQSFTLYPQAKTYFTCHDHSFIACLHHVYILLFFTHILFVVNPTFNATSTERLQQHPLLFTTTAPIARSLYKG